MQDEAKLVPAAIGRLQHIRPDQRGEDQHEPDTAKHTAEQADLAVQEGPDAAEGEQDRADHEAEALVARGFNRVLARKFLVQSGHRCFVLP